MESSIKTEFNMRGRAIILVSTLLLLQPLLLKAQSLIRTSSKGIELRNNHVSILISEKAELLSCIELSTGIDISAHNKKIARAKKVGGVAVSASRASLTNDVLSLHFDKDCIYCKITANDDFFTFEVIGGAIDGFESITFLDLKLDYDFNATNPFLGAGVAMSLQTNPIYYPSGESKEVIGQCFSHTGIEGAKLAVLVCRKDELKGILQHIYASVPLGSIPVNTNGGPFAQDSEYNRRDCIILPGLDYTKIQESIGFYNRWGIRQLDFQLGPQTFLQGDFTFPLLGSASAFKEKITDPLRNAGIISSMHTFSFYISYNSNELLSNIHWQQQLEFRESFTLAKGVSRSDSEFELRGDKSVLKDESSFWSVHSPYVLIDNEIIKYSIGKGGLISCKRGQCGTTAKEHKAGTKVRLIGGYYSHIAPQPGSELFYEIARRTARAYNEGGFNGFYFDAFDGLSVHLKHAGLGDYVWYYGAAFINEVLKNCNEPPLVEYSTLYPTLWAARGRGGAWDTPNRGYKNWIDDHTRSNKTLINRMYIPTLGWFDFYPINKSMPGNYSTKYLFFDDVDYLGARSIAYDQTIVYNGLRENIIESTPALKRNMEVFSNYSNLRTRGYFSDRVKSILGSGQYEYKLIKKNGRWGFRETVYCRDKMRDVKNDQLVGDNPFQRQKPFVRLENLYSSDCSSSISLMRFDDSSEIRGQQLLKNYSSPLDLSKHLAIRVIIQGNGPESSDALCIRLRSSSTSGYSDYIVKTNFNGWKEVVLADLDNAEYPDIVFTDMEDENYRMHRQTIDYSTVRSVQLFVSGACNGVKIKAIDAVPLITNDITNPTVQLGSAAVTFTDVLRSGEYLEYNAKQGDAIIYDSVGNSRSVNVLKKGRFSVPHGRFEASVSGILAIEKAPSQVVLTFGLSGKFIHN